MNDLFRFANAVRHDPAIDEWLAGEPYELYALARHWFTQFRMCGADVNELIHDGYPVACVGAAAFGYVNVYKSHVNVGFYAGADLADPKSLLQGTGKRMRHVKVLPGAILNARALNALIEQAYKDMQRKT
jgi:hypothetical protein